MQNTRELDNVNPKHRRKYCQVVIIKVIEFRTTSLSIYPQLAIFCRVEDITGVLKKLCPGQIYLMLIGNVIQFEQLFLYHIKTTA